MNIVAAAQVIAAGASIMSTIQAINLQISGQRAMGGPVTAGNAYVVGERGPEIFTPTQSGSIVPNDRIGGSTVVNVFNQAPDSRAEVSERMEGGKRVIDILVKKVSDKIASGILDGTGSVTKAAESSYGLRRGR